jgi:putative MATE family efflux protein
MRNNLLEGSVLKKLTLFAIPFLASNVVQSLYNVADMLIVGNFGGTVTKTGEIITKTASMSGVNIGGQVTFILTNAVVGLCVGATVLVGQYIGSKNEDALRKVIATIMTLLPAIAVFLTAVMLIFRHPLLQLIKTPAESYSEADSYLTVTTLGLFFIFGYNALAAILRGMGDSKHPFYFVLAACITNVLLDLLFCAVFKWGAFGAALATVISQAMSMGLCIIYMILNKFQFDFKLSSFKIDKEQLKLILKIGTPTCVANSIVSGSFLFLTTIVNNIGVSASAAVGAAAKFNSFAFMPLIAISSSVSAMSAQSIGANNLKRAVQACQIGSAFCFAIMVVFFAFVQIFPESIIAIFVNNDEVIAYGTLYLRAMSYDFLLVPFTFCINGLLIGGGHTMLSLVSNMVSSIILRAPLCYLFGVLMQMGITGVGMGIPIASLGTLIIMVGYMLTGKWKHNAAQSGAASGEISM